MPKPSNDMKFDGEKIKTELLYKDFVNELEEISEVLTFGAKKYAARSWKNVDNGFERYYAALIRHTNARLKGEMIDPESGKSHLSHAACCLLFMMGIDGGEHSTLTAIDLNKLYNDHKVMYQDVTSKFYDED